MRVAITGMGAVSCLGHDLETIGGALRRGESGIVRDEERVQRGFRSALTGVIRDYDARDYVSRKQVKSMGQPAEYAIGAAMRAIDHARLDPSWLRDSGAGVVVGNDSTVLPAIEAIDSARAHGETHFIGSGSILRVMNSTVTMNLATVLGIRGAAWTLSAACASGAHALGQGYMLIKSGLQDVVLCGGAQEINWPAMAAFDAIGAFAKHEGDPTAASRPFDAQRAGLVPSGGAAILVLERLDRAVERGANILAEMTGYGFSCDGDHLTQPSGDGAARAMREALHQGKRATDEVEYINAHATGTPVGDVAEGRAILEVFGSRTPPVSSTKSMTGHECWMAGASEVLYTLIMMQESFIAPNINLDRPDPELAELDIVTETREGSPRVALSNSFGFGGTNASILLQELVA